MRLAFLERRRPPNVTFSPLFAARAAAALDVEGEALLAAFALGVEDAAGGLNGGGGAAAGDSNGGGAATGGLNGGAAAAGGSTGGGAATAGPYSWT